MPPRFVFAALLLGSLTPHLVAAQSEARWRIGAAVSAPARLLDVTMSTFPDSNDSRVDLGFGYGIEAARLWVPKPGVTLAISGRLTTASVKSHTGGADWSPGRAILADIGGRAERDISRQLGVFIGAQASHWSGPQETAPFSSLGPILLGGEGGVTVRPSQGPWHIDFAANLTRIGADEARNISTGFVWRWMVGVRRDR